MGEKICYQPIGVIHTPFHDPAAMPIQPIGGEEITGTIEIFSDFTPGMKDIDGFSRIILVYHFHRSTASRLEVVPFLDTRPYGVFATRAPARPNPVGISVVRLIKREGSCLSISGIDIVDGTPLLDIKPYVPLCDAFTNGRTGWFPTDCGRVNRARSDDWFPTS